MSARSGSAAVPPAKTPAVEPPLVFVHIRKTAGKTLRQILYREYGRRRCDLVQNYFTRGEEAFEYVRKLADDPPPDLRVAHGHMLFWPDLPWPDGTRFFTMLRDPVERTISHYYWLRARSPKFRKSLEEAVSDGSIHDNLQTRVLAASMPEFHQVGKETLDQALERLDRFAVIGLTERFDESLVLLTRAFGWRRLPYRRENATPNRQPKEEIWPEALEAIERFNVLDMKLYRRATERFERDVAKQGPELAIEVAALQVANERLASGPEDAPLDRLPPLAVGQNDSSKESLDLRSLLIEAQAQLLLREAEIERLRSAPARPTRVVRRPLEDRADTLAAAADSAKRRLQRIKTQIRALEKAGGTEDAAKLEKLRKDAETAEKRLAGFQQRHEKLKQRVSGGKAEKTSSPKAAASGKRATAD